MESPIQIATSYPQVVLKARTLQLALQRAFKRFALVSFLKVHSTEKKIERLEFLINIDAPQLLEKGIERFVVVHRVENDTIIASTIDEIPVYIYCNRQKLEA